MICVRVPQLTQADLRALMTKQGLATPSEVDKKYGLTVGSTAKLLAQHQ